MSHRASRPFWRHFDELSSGQHPSLRSATWRAAALVGLFTLLSVELPAQTFTEYPVATEPIAAIATGSDGNLWFTVPTAGNIGRLTMSGEITQFHIPTENARPLSITAGPDGNLWFTDDRPGGPSEALLGEASPEGVVHEVHVPAFSSSRTSRIAAGSDGRLWYTYSSSHVGRITPDGEALLYQTGYSDLGGITAGPDGNIWFTTGGGGYESKICRITPDGVITQFTVDVYLLRDWAPGEIVSGPDGNLWFTNCHTATLSPCRQFARQLGRITPAGEITLFDIGGEAWGLANWKNHLWVTDGTAMIRVTTAGTVTGRFTLPATAAGAHLLAAGPDGNLWFAASGTIGRFSLEQVRRRAVRH